MQRISGTILVRLVICLLVAVLLAVSAAWAKPTTPDQAQKVVLNWLGKDAIPMGAPLGRQIKEVQTFNYGDAPAYYVVYLNPAGLVFLPADDLVEPIIGFLPDGVYDPSPLNPLGALVSRDIPGRVLQARETEAQALEKGAPLAPHTTQAKAQRKWDWLLTPNSGLEGLEAGLSSISDVRVASFVDSRWSQQTAGGNACYNYYTPPGPNGSASNYPSGCVATAMSQLMRFWQYPVNPVVSSFNIYVGPGPDPVHPNIPPPPQSATIRGGNGSGGNYDWANMTLVPSAATGATQRAAIGALTYDAGISVNMWYQSGSSGTDTLAAGVAFTNTFRYSNARTAVNSDYGNLPEADRNKMVLPNLHARYPILFGITGDGGHAIVCDGYGYNSATMYHHLNMGWAGTDDAWYNLPTINPVINPYVFNSVYKCIYNVYTSGTGEIIAGRVTEANGTTPVSGATVSATGGYSTTTDANGIYALAKVPVSTPFTVSASKPGYTFSSQVVTTGTSANGTWASPSIVCGNRWGVDFVAGGGPSLNLNDALDNTRLSFTNLDAAVWFPETASYYYGGSAAQSGALSDAPVGEYVVTRLRTTVVGPGTLSFYWKVSSELDFDYLDLFIDSTNTDWISGEVGWTKVTKAIPAGIHTVTWQYGKDESVLGGSDCGWVDKVVYSRPGGSAIPLLLLH